MSKTPGQIIYEAMGGTTWSSSPESYREQWDAAARLVGNDARLARIEERLERMEGDGLFCVEALRALIGGESEPAEDLDDDEDPGRDLDGNVNGRPRDQSQPL